MNTQKINDLKGQVIDLIRESLNGKTKSVVITGDEFFDSCPLPVPHDSVMLEVQFEMDITPNGVFIEKTGDPFEWDMDDEFDDDEDEDEDNESEGGTVLFSFDELTLHQLTFILVQC